MIQSALAWEKYLLTLTEGTFFELMRNYLGKISTPFNKHDLIQRLKNYLQQPDTQETIFSLIDQRDAAIISALYFQNRLVENNLSILLEGILNTDNLDYRLKNLEERLLIFRDSESGSGLYELNPLLSDGLKNDIVCPSLIFPWLPREEEANQAPWLTSSLFLAVSSLLADENKIKIRQDGHLNSRSATFLEGIFSPSLSISVEKVFLYMKNLFSHLDLAVQKGENLQLDITVWLKVIPKITETELWAAAAARNREEKKTHIKLIQLLIQALPKDRLISEGVLKKFLLTFSEMSLSQSFLSYFIRSMLDLKILILHGENNLALSDISHISSEGNIIIQQNLDVMVPPHISLEKYKVFPFLMSIHKYDLFSQYVINKDGFISALRKGYSSFELEAELEELTGEKALPSILKVSLTEWAREVKSAELIEGYVLILSKEKDRLVTESGALNEYIKRKPAPGLYVLEERNRRFWMPLLENFGINPLLQEELEREEKTARSLPRESAESNIKDDARDIGDGNEPELPEKVPVKSDFVQKVKESDWSKEEKKLLVDRIKRKIILSEDQLDTENTGNLPREARGFDFHGKLLIIEKGLTEESIFLEIAFTVDDEIFTCLLDPKRLEKGGQAPLLHGITIPGGEELSIPVNRLTLVREYPYSLV